MSPGKSGKGFPSGPAILPRPPTLALDGLSMPLAVVGRRALPPQVPAGSADNQPCMSRSQQSPALERLVQLLIDGADDAVLDHILLDAIHSLELAEGVAIWRIDERGELQTCLTSGAENFPPSREQLERHLAGTSRLGSDYHVVHASTGDAHQESAIVLVLFDQNLPEDMEAADVLLELCARSFRPDVDDGQPRAALPAPQVDSGERELFHDLRNHLAGLRTVCDVLQVLEDELEEDERDHYGAVMKRECRRAGELLASALEVDLTSEAAHRAVDSDLVLALRDVLASEEAAYRQANAELCVRIEQLPGEHSHKLTAFDFSRVVRNLLVNIREACASPAGPATHVLVELQSDKSGRDGLVLAIEDDGPGVALGIREKLFEEGVTTKLQPGAGSGLAAVNAIVHQAGGELLVQHLPVRGTRFQIWIPPS